MCSDAGSLASNEVVTIRNKYPLGGCWLPATADQQERDQLAKDSCRFFRHIFDIEHGTSGGMVIL